MRVEKANGYFIVKSVISLLKSCLLTLMSTFFEEKKIHRPCSLALRLSSLMPGREFS